MSSKVLIVAAHPDDEILGAGGTILRHIASGDTVHIMIMAEGLTSRGKQNGALSYDKELSALHKTAYDVASFMGVSKLVMEKFPDNRMDIIPLLDIVKCIEEEVENFQPDIVYTHHFGDVNIDHQITHNAVLTACRPMPGTSVCQLLFFETMSSTEWQIMTADKVFLPNLYVDISAYLDKKIEALHFYASEMREYPHSRSYEALFILAKQRGFTIGRQAAEAFMLGRLIR